MRKRITCLFMLLVITLSSSALADNKKLLSCCFFDVDKADAMLIIFPDGACIMIDAGTNKVGKTLAAKLKAEGITKLDALVITHFDKDHVGGADKLLETLSISCVVMPGYKKESKQYTQFLDALATSPRTEKCILKAREETVFSFGGANLRISAAHEMDYGVDEENDFSLAGRLSYGDIRFFFTGDAEDARQRELLEEGDILCDVLKVPYHGRAVTVSSDFLSACAPKIAWIPDGPEDEADPGLVQYLEEKLGTEVYRSAVDEDLVVISDGITVWVEETGH